MKNFFKKVFTFHLGLNNSDNCPGSDKSVPDNTFLSGNLKKDIDYLENIFINSSDINYRKFQLGDGTNAELIFIDNMVDSKLLQSAVLTPLTKFNANSGNISKTEIHKLMNYLEEQVITTINVTDVIRRDDIIDDILNGNTVLFIENVNEALSIGLPRLEKRSISESVKEPVIRGPRDSFIEDLDTNITLIRRRIKSPSLKIEKIKIGRISKTQVAILYINGIVNDSILLELRERLNKIKIDAILESGNIEELIEDSKFSIFPQLNNTERPDKLAGCLLEGQIGIMVDNTPTVLIAPQTFIQMMQSPDDYSERYISSSLIRFMRFIYLIVALLLPSIYIAISSFHQALIPANLLLTMAAAHENIPFPSLVEAFIMEIFFEGLREAGVRLPRPVGQAVSIVGALIIGQAAVQAGIISAPMVIIVSVTGISSFIIPSFSLGLSFRVLRFAFMILAGVLGLYGIYIGLMVMLIHMCKLRSFGVPYLSPLFPVNISSLKDSIVRLPRWKMTERPEFITKENKRRIR